MLLHTAGRSRPAVHHALRRRAKAIGPPRLLSRAAAACLGLLAGTLAWTAPAQAGQRPAAGARSATAQPHVKLSVTSGPPTSQVTVSGSGFAAHELVDIYFGTTDEALASTNGKGRFSGIAIGVPASAAPGVSYVSAEGRRSGLGAQAPFLVNTDWDQPGFSATHQGDNPYENVLSPSTVSGLHLQWSYGTGSADAFAPMEDGGVVYVTTFNGSLDALNAATGAQMWSFPTGSLLLSPPAVSGGIVYFGTFGGTEYALDAATGAQMWSFTAAGGILGAPAVANGVVYVTDNAGNVYALTAATGQPLWTYATGAEITTAVAVANGTVYATNTSGNVYALTAATGQPMWTDGAGAAATTAPTVANGLVYVGSANDSVYALNAVTGVGAWSFATNGEVVAAPAVAGDVVYIDSEDGNLYALAAGTGSELWSFTTGAGIAAAPAVAGGVVYVGSGDQNLYALDTYGDELWSFATGGIVDSPAVANGVVYASSGGDVYAFSLTGSAESPRRPDPRHLHPDYALRPRPSQLA
jgi:outer membrane protein assembly factor BamB